MSHAQKWVAAWKWPRFCTNPLRLTRRRSTSRGRGKAIPPLLPSKTLCLVAFLASVCVKQRFHVVFPPLSSCVCVCVWVSACVYFLRFSCSGRKRGRWGRGFETQSQAAASFDERGREAFMSPCTKCRLWIFFFFLRAGFPLDGSSQAS